MDGRQSRMSAFVILHKWNKYKIERNLFENGQCDISPLLPTEKASPEAILRIIGITFKSLITVDN